MAALSEGAATVEGDDRPGFVARSESAPGARRAGRGQGGTHPVTSSATPASGGGGAIAEYFKFAERGTDLVFSETHTELDPALMRAESLKSPLIVAGWIELADH